MLNNNFEVPSIILNSKKNVSKIINNIFSYINNNNWNIIVNENLPKTKHKYSTKFKISNDKNITGIITLKSCIKTITNSINIKSNFLCFKITVKFCHNNNEIKKQKKIQHALKSIVFNFRKKECFIYNDNVYNVWNRNIRNFMNQKIRNDVYLFVESVLDNFFIL